MKNILALFVLISVCLTISCSSRKTVQKGFQVSETYGSDQTSKQDGLNKDSLKFETRPSSVLLTGTPNVRLTTVYKVNFRKDNKTTFIGSNSFIYKDESESDADNNWNSHIIPGLEAVYGYNLVNISHYDIKKNKQKLFFEKPVLIKTLYYPAFSRDTLKNKPVNREYFIVSAYNEDTNKDNFINLNDLRRLYLFNLNGDMQKQFIPENYSVYKSDYDSDNDFMYIFAQLDMNGNGSRDEGEPIHIFWIDLKNPTQTGRKY